MSDEPSRNEYLLKKKLGKLLKSKYVPPILQADLVEMLKQVESVLKDLDLARNKVKDLEEANGILTAERSMLGKFRDLLEANDRSIGGLPIRRIFLSREDQKPVQMMNVWFKNAGITSIDDLEKHDSLEALEKTLHRELSRVQKIELRAAMNVFGLAFKRQL